MKRVLIKDIISYLGSEVISVRGDYDGVFVDNLADVAHTTLTTLDWVKPTNPRKQIIVESTPARAIIVGEGVDYSDKVKEQSKILIEVQNPRNIIAIVGNHFFAIQHIANGIHPTAVIDPEADIADGVSIGAYSVVGKVKIGKNTRISSRVTIYGDVVIGENCVIETGAVIGSSGGAGYEKDENGNLFRFPQLGKVCIGNYVDIGANTCIERGALSITTIGDYTKIDNLCHIAHNNIIGSNCVITAGTIIAGSNVIGDNVWFGPNSSVKDWAGIESNSLVGMGSVVLSKVKEGTHVFGVPARRIVIDNKDKQ